MIPAAVSSTISEYASQIAKYWEAVTYDSFIIVNGKPAFLSTSYGEIPNWVKPSQNRAGSFIVESDIITRSVTRGKLILNAFLFSIRGGTVSILPSKRRWVTSK